MDPDKMQPIEVPEGCRFRSTNSLREHVIKHVLEGRDERWHQVVGNEALSAPRDERAFGRDEFEPNCRIVARLYEETLARAVHRASGAGVEHVHVAEVEVDADYQPLAARSQSVEAWPSEELLFIVARAPVSDGALGPSTLRTGYRPHPKLGRRAHARKCRERQSEKARLLSVVVLAVHDAGESETR